MENYSVLVVDDSSTNRFLLLAKLRKCGIAVELAVNGEEAVSKAEEKDYDLIFLDIQMPLMDGFTALRNIKKLKPDLPIVAWTCSVDPHSDDLIERGFNDALEKPLDTADFKRIIEKFLDLTFDSNAVSYPDDKELCLELNANLSDPLALSIKFRSQLSSRLEHLEQLSHAGEWDELSFFAYKLRGTAKVQGLKVLADWLKSLEICCKLKDKEQALHCIQTLRRSVNNENNLALTERREI
jgi:CheY-like chemotaxis protein